MSGGQFHRGSDLSEKSGNSEEKEQLTKATLK
jgi:hypothetical protein